jgi:hypothetical protein
MCIIINIITMAEILPFDGAIVDLSNCDMTTDIMMTQEHPLDDSHLQESGINKK